MKVVFLDIDGVMNSDVSIEDWFKEHGELHSMIPHPMHVANLNHITDATGASIVISSTWRLGCQNSRVLAHMLYLCGVTGDIIGVTPRCPGEQRGYEIQEFIDEFNASSFNREGPITDFVILDDDSDMAHLMKYLVSCDDRKGLTVEEAEKAVNMLGGD